MVMRSAQVGNKVMGIGRKWAGFLAAIIFTGAACGSSQHFQQKTDSQLVVVDDAVAQKANISIYTMFNDGYAPQSTCDGNIAWSPPATNQNVTYCRAWHVEQLTNDGHFELVYGCFVGYADHPSEMMSLLCRTYTRDEKALSEDEWLSAKKTILGTQPMTLTSAGCDEDCPPDYTPSSFVITIDGQQRSISWSDYSDNIAANLQILVDKIRSMGFFFFS